MPVPAQYGDERSDDPPTKIEWPIPS